MCSADAGQHLVFDAEIVDGLVHAWKARRALGLPDETAREDRRPHPPRRLVALLALADDPPQPGQLVRAHVRRRRDGDRAPGPAAPRPARRQLRALRRRAGRNFGAGLRFQYLPAPRAYARSNVDSAEYANIVLSFLRFYDQARRAGMAPLSRAGRSLVRRWERRAIAGYWTHGGYLNWDSGLGFERWHQAKKLGLAQQALIGIAQAPQAAARERVGGVGEVDARPRAALLRAAAGRARAGCPTRCCSSSSRVPQSLGSARLAAARLQANAARAVEAGLGRMRAAAPPPLYAYDPDIGRLAVTTPAYNTAIVAVNQRAFPYGGIELARLFDGDQRVAANVGGRAPAAFGLLVRQPNGRRVFSSQTARARIDPAVTPLRLTRAPTGTGATAATAPGGKVFAGPFKDLRARGTLTAGRFRAVTSHRFTPTHDRDELAARAPLRARAAARRRAAAELGRRGARVVAVLRDGSRVSLRARRGAARARRAVRDRERAQRLHRRAAAAAGGRRGARARPLTPVVEPRPGPTLAIEIAQGSTWRRARFAARIAVAR